MKTPTEILEMIERRISNMQHRSLMYGGTPAGVDLVFFTYHSIWSDILDRGDEFVKIWHAVGDEEDCGAANFSTRYRMNHPHASEEEIADYTVQQWRKVSARLGLPITENPPVR